MIDFIKKYLDYFLTIIVDIGLFILKPRTYFNILKNESNKSFIKRIIALTILFFIISVSIFSVVLQKRDNLDYFKFIGAGIFEIIIALFYFIPIWFASYFYERKVTIKEVIGFLLTAKFTLVLIPILFYVLFLATEDYTFAVFRALFTYLTIIVIFFAVPALNSFSVKKRIQSILATFISLVVWIFIIGSIFSLNTIGKEKMKKSFLLYDPIGKECLTITSTFKQYDLTNELAELSINYLKAINIKNSDDKSYILSISNNQLNQFSSKFASKSSYYLAVFNSRDSLINELHSSLRYQTSRDLLDAYKNDFLAEKKLYIELSKSFSPEGLKNYVDLSTTYISLIKNHNAYVDRQNEIISKLNQLVSMMIIIH